MCVHLGTTHTAALASPKLLERSLKLFKDPRHPGAGFAQDGPLGLQHGGYEAFRCHLLLVVHWAGEPLLGTAGISRGGNFSEPGIISAHLKQVAEICQGALEA